jgi:hypothetical protein
MTETTTRPTSVFTDYKTKVWQDQSVALHL